MPGRCGDQRGYQQIYSGFPMENGDLQWINGDFSGDLMMVNDDS